jgi:hypothetical protein
LHTRHADSQSNIEITKRVLSKQKEKPKESVEGRREKKKNKSQASSLRSFIDVRTGAGKQRNKKYAFIQAYYLACRHAEAY